MDLGSLFLIFTVIVLVSLFISRPFLKRQPSASVSAELDLQDNEHQRSALLADRDRIINALQELDFDNVLGKIPAEEYPAQRLALLTSGADILRKLDAYAQVSPEQGAEDRLEAAIAARRADLARRTPDKPSLAAAEADEVERLIATRRRSQAVKSGGFCPKCGRPVQKIDRFCPKCGASLGKPTA
ncbi:MAG: zinc ribbon domain-containing protein [Chloroflexi bacterium]|nr:zinc ribbon domain-containing protein [Chloroflexota bacterium]